MICRLSPGGWLLLALLCTLPLFVIWPDIDIESSRLFFDHDRDGFWLRKAFVPEVVHVICAKGSWLAGVFLALAAPYAYFKNKKVAGLESRMLMFLFTVLLIGPGLVTNTIFKDFWGRARPYQIDQFDGDRLHTPPLMMADQCDHNCSFFSGDGAMGFSLHTLFYLVPLAAPAARRRRIFWWGFLGGGILFGGNRVIMGSHFLSDVIFSGIFMLAVSAALHTLFYGWQNTKNYWRAIIWRN